MHPAEGARSRRVTLRTASRGVGWVGGWARSGTTAASARAHRHELAVALRDHRILRGRRVRARRDRRRHRLPRLRRPELRTGRRRRGRHLHLLGLLCGGRALAPVAAAHARDRHRHHHGSDRRPLDVRADHVPAAERAGALEGRGDGWRAARSHASDHEDTSGDDRPSHALLRHQELRVVRPADALRRRGHARGDDRVRRRPLDPLPADATRLGCDGAADLPHCRNDARDLTAPNRHRNLGTRRGARCCVGHRRRTCHRLVGRWSHAAHQLRLRCERPRPLPELRDHGGRGPVHGHLRGRRRALQHPGPDPPVVAVCDHPVRAPRPRRLGPGTTVHRQPAHARRLGHRATVRPCRSGGDRDVRGVDVDLWRIHLDCERRDHRAHQPVARDPHRVRRSAQPGHVRDDGLGVAVHRARGLDVVRWSRT